MDTPPGRKELSHERIVDAAARAIRRAGFSGVGVADIMKEAGLTHGGFYAHFASRNALLAQALERAGRDSAARLEKSAALRQARGDSAFRALVEGYLSDRHLGSTESGCPVAALASEMPRQASEVRDAAARRVRSLVARVQSTLPPAAAPQSAAERARPRRATEAGRAVPGAASGRRPAQPAPARPAAREASI